MSLLLFFTLLSTTLAVPTPSCPPLPPVDCMEGTRACSGDIDPVIGCQEPDSCVPEGDSCPFYCPHHGPRDCGEGMTNCPGDTDPMGCPMPNECVAEGDACPFFCPRFPPVNCGFVMSYCPGPIDAMGCEGPQTCVLLAEGEQCPPA